MLGMGDLLWAPTAEFRSASNLQHFIDWLRPRGHDFDGYESLRAWSVADVAGFWEALWQYFEVRSSTPYDCVLRHPQMPGAEWFPGAHVNYAQHLLRGGADDAVAAYVAGERVALNSISRGELRSRVYTCATALRALGVVPGDRVAAYLPNIPEALIGFLATAAIGAVWSSCSPDFGAATVIDRFSQIAPKVLIATDGYFYGGKEFDRRSEVRKMIAALPSLQHIVQVRGLIDPDAPLSTDAKPWSSLFDRAPVRASEFVFENTAFSHPLWIVYSSGTTGLPKPFAHGHGGILLEALKFTHFHLNLKPDSCMFFFTTTGWVMWNILLSSLVAGAAMLLFDGNPSAPDPEILWRLAQDAGVTLFGTSPAFLNQQMAQGIQPNRKYDLSRVEAALVSGSPVMPEHMQWCLDQINPKVWISSQSGGTDVATAFVGGAPLLPVHAGEIQTRCLAVDVVALDDHGNEVIDRVGELVVRQPMPSMPLYFWNDADGKRYRDSYFDVYPGFWRHGDYLKVNARGGCMIMGRSDSTLNRHGVRIGTAEIYRIVEALAPIKDSLIVNLDLPGGHSFMPLFVTLQDGLALDAAIEKQIRQALKDKGSPRHVPDRIYAVPAIPFTLTGKKLEVPVRKILLGQAADKVASRDAMVNPQALDWFVEYAASTEDYQHTAI